jgi:hypothetical protein
MASPETIKGKVPRKSKQQQGIHHLIDLLMADFMVVDVSKPFAEPSYLEIERKLLAGKAYQTCGGRSLNEDTADSFLTWLVNADNGPRISDGVDRTTELAAYTFPYLAPPEQNPPPVILSAAALVK